jgi:flagellar basal body-associated protein FliL
MPNLDPNIKRRNWIVLIVLLVVALAMYVSFMVKMMSHG